MFCLLERISEGSKFLLLWLAPWALCWRWRCHMHHWITTKTRSATCSIIALNIFDSFLWTSRQCHRIQPWRWEARHFGPSIDWPIRIWINAYVQCKFVSWTVMGMLLYPECAGKRWTLQGGGLERPLDAADAAGKRGRLLTGLRSHKKKRLAGKVGLKRPLDAAAGKRGLERPLDAAGKRWTLQGGGAGKAVTLQGSAGRCREGWEAFEGGRRQSWNRKKQLVAGIYRSTLQLSVGSKKAIGRCREALDAAGKRGRVLRGAGGSLGTVRKRWWVESTAGRCSLLDRPGNATRRYWTLQGSVGGFWGGQAAVSEP